MKVVKETFMEHPRAEARRHLWIFHSIVLNMVGAACQAPVGRRSLSAGKRVRQLPCTLYCDSALFLPRCTLADSVSLNESVTCTRILIPDNTIDYSLTPESQISLAEGVFAWPTTCGAARDVK